MGNFVLEVEQGGQWYGWYSDFSRASHYDIITSHVHVYCLLSCIHDLSLSLSLYRNMQVRATHKAHVRLKASHGEFDQDQGYDGTWYLQMKKDLY